MAKQVKATRRKTVSPTTGQASGEATTNKKTSVRKSATKARKAIPVLTEEQIRTRAFEIFQRRNGGPGDAHSDWLEAESELRSETLT